MRPAVGHGYPEDDTGFFFLGPKYGAEINWAYERKRIDWAYPILSRYGVVFPSEGFADRNLPSGMTPGMCFENATRTALRSSLEVVYCEGVLFGVDQRLGIPVGMLHAWCYCPALKVAFDPTGPALPSTEGVTFVGIPFNSVYVASQRQTQGFYGLLDGHPTLGDSVGPYADPENYWLHPCWHTLERYYGPI